ncbi:MAG: S8 family serine peptidase, partial [Planctomycetes bacterium]|nr:S8 family serine peptidase [Planctomycetota bacterium]
SMSGNANIWADYQNGTLNSVTPIGVIDSGFALHSDLAVERIHFSNGGLDAEQDVYGHGTQVLGALMGRGLSDVDAKGANPFLASRTVGRVWLARYFDDAGNPVGDINDLYTALSTAQSGSWIPKVINCSWGASPIGGAAYSGTEQECLDIDAIAYSTKQLYVFAAGNDGANGASTVGVPGAAANVLTVGNIKSYELTQGDGTLGEIALSSSQGPTADGRMKPELTAPGGGDAGDAGSGVLTTSSTDLSGYVTASGGTSMAVPQVSALAASLTDRYAYLSFNSPALRAALMASAMHPGGAAQDDDYGFGMVDAYRAHHSSSSWEGFHIPHISVKEGFNDAFDDSITIPVGTTRMTIAVCWNEPALSTPGGASPVTGHLDLGIDYGRTGANDIVVNGDANYQYLVVDNPTPGPLQLNFIARDTDFDDNGTFERLIAGAAVLLESNTTPSLASSGNLSDDALQLDETSSISTTLSTDVGLASLTIANLMNWSAGLPIESVEYTLQDGSTRFIAAPDATSSVVLGSLIEAAPRTITWSFRGATEGEYALTMKANSDNAGNAVDTYTLWVDSTAPALVTNLTSVTHTAGDWSDSNDVRITWDAAIDNDAPNGESGSGIDGYSTSMTQGAGADPDQIANHNESAVLEDFLGLNDGTHFFRIATQDRAGNWSSPAFAQEFGPIMIDTAGPDASGMDLSVTSGHATGVWSNDDTIDFAWSAATEPDDASGLAGYSTDSDTSTLEIAAESTAHTEPFPDGKSNANRFAIIPVDLIGNAGSTSDVLGPFWIDDTAPSAVTGTTPDQPANLWTKNPIFNFPGATATDATSGLAGFDTNGDGIADDNFTRNYPEGNGNEFTIRAIDNATNPGATSTFGPFWVDFTKPTDVTNLAANASANEWLTSDQVQFTWTPSTDDLSGLLGYDLNDDDEADLAAAASSYDAEFPEGKANFFGLAPIDVAKNIGNKNGPIGPFWVDTEAPTTPTQLNADQTESTWSNDNTVGFAWVPSTDATSGLEGYDSTGDGLVDLDPNTVSKVVPFLDGDTNEFSLTPHDIAGNVGVTAGPKGPFWIDTVDPDSPSDLTSDQGVSQWTNDPTVNFSWTAASDDL